MAHLHGARAIAKSERARAAEVLDLLIAHAESSGMAAFAVVWKWGIKELDLASGEHHFLVGIREVVRTVPQYSRQLSTTLPEPTGILELWLRGPGLPYGGKHFRDMKRTSIAEKAPALIETILEAIPEADAEAAHRREAMEEAARAQVRRREAEAEKRVFEIYESDLLSAVERAERAGRVRAYLAGLEARSITLTAAELDDAKAWMDWIRTYASRIDPTQSPIRMPETDYWKRAFGG
jgi:hypothetical protein